ncbi:MAG: alpha/beta fold hydrolase [Pseudomonadota bacterium]
MDPMRKGQRWILDAFIASGGIDVLHPEAGAVLEELGYNSSDLKRVFERVKATSMVVSAWNSVAAEVTKRADYWYGRGCRAAAHGLYERATLLYARAHYSIMADDPRRTRYLHKMLQCQARVMELTPHHIERVQLPFEGQQLHGVFECQRQAAKQPCVIFLPGMDMFKEDWHGVIRERVLPRGWCGFAFDGPGQGETLTRGLKMTLDNYERALSSVIDWLSRQPQVDPQRIVIMGSSMGSWWGARAAAVEPRIRAVAANMSNLGDKFVLLNQAQPSFMTGLMFMTGIDDVDALQEFSKTMTLTEVARKITAPFLVVAGENDELTTLESTIDFYQRVSGPKELLIYQHEFHPIGPQSNEWINASLDWLEQAMSAGYAPDYARQTFITKSGEYHEGSGEPLWWNP